MLLRVLPIVIVIAALVVYFAGGTEVALVLVVAGVGAMVALNFLRSNNSTPAPELDAEQSAELRAERERSGEVAAVRRLRKEHPGVSLVDAVRLVRKV